MRSVHRDVFALLEQWRDEIDAAELTAPIDLPALRARRAFESQRFPTVAATVERVRACGPRDAEVPPTAEVTAPAVAAQAATSIDTPQQQAWILDDLYPYPAAG